MERFSVVVADPPWRYELYSDAGETKAPQRHYKCLGIEDIIDLPVADIVEKDAVLFLWATNPLLDVAFDVIKAWGFKYTTKVEWVKMCQDGTRIRCGTGYRVLGATEPLLIATRGNVFCPRKGTRLPGVIIAPRPLDPSTKRMKHSAKPPNQWTYFEQYPGRKIELFARDARLGWTTLGNEIDGRDIRDSLPEVARQFNPQLTLL